MMEPIFKGLAKTMEGKAVFVKINTDQNRDLQSRYAVNSVPSFLFFGPDGKKKKQFSGGDEFRLRQFSKEIVKESEA